MKLERLIISCGGTGGHFFPGLSIARTFRKQGGEVMLLLSGVNAQSQAQCAENFRIKAVALPVMPSWKRKPLAFLRGLFRGYRESVQTVKEFSPQAVLGMGSFAMTPVLLGALKCHVPVFLHDGNARIGRGNRIFSRWAKLLGAGFPAVNGDKCRCRVSDVGMPVRPELLECAGISRKEALDKLNAAFGCELKEENTTILIFGGSQGAAVFNSVLPQALKACGAQDIQVLHLCGKGKKVETEKLYRDAAFPVLLLESSDRMEYFLGSADAVFSRSGGSTLAELALFGKGAFLIPYPYAAEGHQQDNAEYFERNGAALVIGNEDFSVEKAVELLNNEVCAGNGKLAERGMAAKQLARPDASLRMLEEISAIIG